MAEFWIHQTEKNKLEKGLGILAIALQNNDRIKS